MGKHTPRFLPLCYLGLVWGDMGVYGLWFMVAVFEASQVGTRQSTDMGIMDSFRGSEEETDSWSLTEGPTWLVVWSSGTSRWVEQSQPSLARIPAAASANVVGWAQLGPVCRLEGV